MALKGKLRDFSLTQLLNLIHLARKSGALSLDSAEGHVELFFHEGKLIHATQEGHANQLADLMVRAGKLTQGQRASLHASGRVRDDRQLGLLLINAGQIAKSDIVQLLRSDMMDIIHHTFRWQEGSFLFDQRLKPPSGRILIPVPLDSIIVEGSRQREEQSELHAELPSLDVVLKFTDGPGSNLRNINLSVDEWKVISFINPRNTVATIARFNQMNEFQVRRIVAKLLRDQLVEVVEPTTRRAPPTPLPEEPRPLSATPSPVLASASAADPDAVYSKPDVSKGIIRRLIDRIKRL